MSKLLVPLLWIAAAAVGCYVFWRLRRRRRVVFPGQGFPRFVHMVAVVLVFLNGCTGSDSTTTSVTAPAPAHTTGADALPPQAQAPSSPVDVPSSSDFPPKFGTLFPIWNEFRTVQMPELKRNLALLERADTRDVDRDLAALKARRILSTMKPRARHIEVVEPLRQALLGQVERQSAAEPRNASLGELSLLLQCAEKACVFDAWLAGYVWRQTGGGAGPPTSREAGVGLWQVLGRVERHLRIAHTLQRTVADKGTPVFTPWRSKAARPKDWRQAARAIRLPGGFLDHARKIFSRTNAGTWNSAVVLPLMVESGVVTLIRRGHEVEIEAGSRLVLRRLDVLQTTSQPVVVRHQPLGTFVIPPARTASAWNVAEFLDDGGTRQIEQWIAAARDGSAAALEQLEELLMITHPGIRAELIRSPDSAHAPALRTVLSLFDE